MDDRAAVSPAPHEMRNAELLTIVVVPLLGGEALASCLRAFQAQGATLLVVGGEDLQAVDAMVVRAPDPRVPARRRLGLRAARTPFVAFFEDTCEPAEGWSDAIVSALSEDDVVGVGGPIAVSRDLSPRFRALGLCEYARFGAGRIEKLAAGGRTRSGRAAMRTLPGANFAVRRAAVEACEYSDEDLIDHRLFAAATRGGGALVMDEAMSAAYAQPHAQGALLATRFHHGRIYGASVSAGRAPAGRLIAGMIAALAPAVLTLRTLVATPAWHWRSGATIAWVAAMHCAWGVGEVLGKISGRAGSSLRYWI